MRRLVLLCFVLLLCVAGVAQTEHMKFAGIPLTGTIDKFQGKLLAKGYTLMTGLNKSLPVGTRAFKGVFAGEKASVAVYYDTNTKIVYAAKAYYDNLTDDRSKYHLNNLKSLLSSKYGEEFVSEGRDDNGETFTIMTDLGNIYGYLRMDESMYN